MTFPIRAVQALKLGILFYSNKETITSLPRECNASVKTDGHSCYQFLSVNFQ